MKVKDLIERLQELDPELPVYYWEEDAAAAGAGVTIDRVSQEMGLPIWDGGGILLPTPFNSIPSSPLITCAMIR